MCCIFTGGPDVKTLADQAENITDYLLLMQFEWFCGMPVISLDPIQFKCEVRSEEKYSMYTKKGIKKGSHFSEPFLFRGVRRQIVEPIKGIV